MTEAVNRVALAREAVVWGLPLVMFGRYLDAAVEAGVAFNQFYMSTQLATPQSSAVGPNIDTLNGRAWLDLSTGPQVIEVPDTADRYYSIQLQDMYTNTFAYIGRRTHGTDAAAFAILPPEFAGSIPPGLIAISATTTKVFAFVRTLVRGPDDTAAVRALNAAFSIGDLLSYPAGQRAALVSDGALDAFQPKGRRDGNTLPHQEIEAAGAGFFDELDRLVHAFPLLPADQAHLARFTPLGLGPGRLAGHDAALEAELAAAVPAGITAAMDSLKAQSDHGWSDHGWSRRGWSRRRNVAQFIDDPTQRAANCIYGPSTQVAEESVFFNMREDPDGNSLTGARRYRLRFEADELPPVDAFWSLTLYDRRYFVLIANPLARYGITDRTQGLHYGTDGSLDIWIQADEPAEGFSNWLPAPRDEFQLILRTYQPRQQILNYSYHPPAARGRRSQLAVSRPNLGRPR